jgi:hypothetical protein
MSVQNNSRATDLGEVLTSGTTGFMVRKRTGIGLFFHFFLLACMVVMGASLLVYYHSPVGCVVAVAIGLSFALIAQNLEKQKKHKESLEFMNALFSSAIGKGYLFACIVKISGEIVFYNRPFQAIFPGYTAQDTRTLKALLDLYNVPEGDRDSLRKFMTENSGGSIATTINAKAQTEKTSITFHLEPIERPTGFFLLRGK